MILKRELQSALALFRPDGLKPALVLAMAALVPAVHRYVATVDASPAGIGPSATWHAPLFLFGSAFVLFGLVPLLCVVLVFRESPRDYGLRLGDWRLGLSYTALLLPLAVALLLYPSSRTPEMRAFYPLYRGALGSPAALLQLEAARGLLYYSAWEFFFRGFVLFGLRGKVGDGPAILIQVVPSCLWHIGLPFGEVVASVVGGVLFGVMALRTRSVLWPWLFHLGIGIALDVLIVGSK